MIDNVVFCPRCSRPCRIRYRTQFGGEFTRAKDDYRVALTREDAINRLIDSWTHRVKSAQRELEIAQDGLTKALKLAEGNG